MPKPAKKPTKKAAKTTRARKPDAYPYPGADVVSGMRRHRKISIVFAVVVGALLVWWGFNAIKTEVQFRQDKKQYAAAEANMAEVYSHMVAATGKPVELQLTKTCGHKSAKLEQGTLVCGVDYSFFYSTDDATQAQDLREYIISVAQGYSKVKIEGLFKQKDVSEKTQRYGFDGNDGLYCGISYDLKTASQHDDVVGTNVTGAYTKPTGNAYAAEFGFNCHSAPVKPVYSVVKD